MDIRKSETIKRAMKSLGHVIKSKLLKNKMAPPFKQAFFVVDKNGIDKEEAIIDAAVEIGSITKSGAFL